MLTREQILGILDLKSEIVAVPEWGGDVSVRGLTGTERDEYEQTNYQLRQESEDGTSPNVRARMASLAIVGVDGKQLFTEADIEALGGKSGAALDRIYEVAYRLSGMGAEDVEEMEKNSSSAPNSSSTPA